MSILKKQLDVTTRASKQGSAECHLCSVLKRAEQATVSMALKRDINKIMADHIEFMNGEVEGYSRRAFEAKDNPKMR